MTGGVLGAMRVCINVKIQEESLYYEQLKDSGEMPIVGINTFLSETTRKSKKLNCLDVQMMSARSNR